ncbi:MAG: hypothetical protein UMR38_01845 [Candidatus Izemoplasma sp.]|nr:hypothetical protein [Candidatus Izemoplasma sp.]
MKDITKAIKTIVADNNMYCYDVLYEREKERFFVRVLLDKETGITIDDCQTISQEVSTKLDELDPFKDPYYLEVMSAGIEHELRNDEEIKLSLGKKIFVKTYEQVFTGTLLKYKDGLLTIQIDNKNTVDVSAIDAQELRLSI